MKSHLVGAAMVVTILTNPNVAREESKDWAASESAKQFVMETIENETRDIGLIPWGKSAIDEMARVWILLDQSHTDPKTADAAMYDDGDYMTEASNRGATRNGELAKIYGAQKIRVYAQVLEGKPPEQFLSLEFGYTRGPDRSYLDNIHVPFWQSDAAEDSTRKDDHGIAISVAWFLGNQWLPFVRYGVSEGDVAILGSRGRVLF